MNLQLRPHLSILLTEYLSFFEGRSIRYFLDGTVGAGGHSRALLEVHPEIEQLYGMDRDEEALELAKEHLAPYRSKVRLVQGNFRDMKDLLPPLSFEGIFLDLGVSSMQLDRPEKGFSLYHEGPLDMRMDIKSPLTAARVLNTFSEQEIGKIFREYGEERRWRRAAHAVVESRKKKSFQTTKDLCEALKTVLTWRGRKGKNIHPMTLIFQGLRIYVNDELGALEEGLLAAMDLLASGGRLGVISFHSLEDRIVKHCFRQFVKEGRARLLIKKPLQAGFEEKRHNPRSRSAKMRFIEKL